MGVGAWEGVVCTLDGSGESCGENAALVQAWLVESASCVDGSCMARSGGGKTDPHETR